MKTIITIGRQYGSGGREIGKRLSEKLGIGYYDKELLRKAAQNSGLCEKVMESFDERPKSLLYSLAMDTYMFNLPGVGATDSLEQQVYLATFDSIRRVADEGPCVIIGRCADYALSAYDNVIHLFISAPMEQRVARVSQRKDLTADKAKLLINRTDKRRAAYYEYYASGRWGQVNTYDCCIDSSLLGIEGTADFLANLIATKDAQG